MKKVLFENTTDRFLHIGPVTIPPHDWREVDERDIPGSLKPMTAGQKQPAPVAQPRDALKELWQKPAKEVIAGIPALSVEDLKRLEEMESGRMVKDKPAVRTSVLAAIQGEVLARADKAAQAGAGGNQA